MRDDSGRPDTGASDVVPGVLSGRVHYDRLTPVEQAAVRDAWETEIAVAIRDLDYEKDFRASGDRWAEADARGHLVLRSPQ